MFDIRRVAPGKTQTSTTKHRFFRIPLNAGTIENHDQQQSGQHETSYPFNRPRARPGSHDLRHRNRLPDSKEIWYGHSILTSTLFPATPPAEGTDFVSKDNSTVEYILEAGIDSLTRSRDFPMGNTLDC